MDLFLLMIVIIEEKGNLDIIESIMNEIKIYKPSFNYNSCLFFA